MSCLVTPFRSGLALMLGLVLLGGLLTSPATARQGPEAPAGAADLQESGELLPLERTPGAEDIRRPSVQPPVRRHEGGETTDFRGPVLVAPVRSLGSGPEANRPRPDPVTFDWGRRPFRL